MDKLNNLTYDIQIDFINNSGNPITISKRIQDNGLETNTFQTNEVCISEETINGRVLSGRFETKDCFCGYKYNYDEKSSNYLVSLNDEISIDTAVSLINKVKATEEFWNAKLALTSLMKNDYRVFAINKGNIDLTKSVSAKNKNSQDCAYTEFIHLSKQAGEEIFSEKSRETTYEIGDEFISDSSASKEKINDLKVQMKDLIKVLNQNPNNYKDLIKIKESDQQSPNSPSI